MNEITHHIQKSIIKKLSRQKTARYSELRPAKIESNLYAYHLKILIKNGFISKNGRDYSLTPHGLNYVDRISFSDGEFILQPKIMTRIILKNSRGQFLLTKRNKQPLIDMWGFISGKIHPDDGGIEAAARREIEEKIGVSLGEIQHLGDYYVKIFDGGEVISNTFSHVFYAEISSQVEEKITLSEDKKWVFEQEFGELEMISDTRFLISKIGGEKFFDELKISLK